MLIMCRLTLDTVTLRIRRDANMLSPTLSIVVVYQHDQNVYVARGKSKALIYSQFAVVLSPADNVDNSDDVDEKLFIDVVAKTLCCHQAQPNQTQRGSESTLDSGRQSERDTGRKGLFGTCSRRTRYF